MLKRKFLFDLQRFAVISNSQTYSLVSGTSGADTIKNSAGGVTIQAGAGNDSIYSSTTITINNSYGYVTIDAGDGNDTIYNFDPYVSINSGAGNDSISISGSSYGSNITVNGGTGNDTIDLSSGGSKRLIKYNSGDGNDTITGFLATDTLSLGSGIYYTRSTVGSNVVVNIQGGGAVTLGGASSLGSNLNIYGGTLQSGGVTLKSSYSNSYLIGASGNDSLYIANEYVTANGGAGKDTIYIDSGQWYANVSGGDGNDSIYNYTHYATIDGGADNDTIKCYYSSSSINGGTGNDLISVAGGTVKGGTGDDTIYVGSGNGLIYQYALGDGYDLIQNWASNNTLSLGSGIYYTRSTGSSNVVVSIQGGGAVTLSGAASLSSVNIVGGTLQSDSSNKTLKSSSGYTSLVGGSGNDSLYNSYYSVTMSGGAGNDTIKTSWGDRVSINGGAGNDLISVSAAGGIWYQTIKGGTGDDTIYGNSLVSSGYGSTYQFSSGDGNDIIYGYTSYDKISLGGGYYTRETVGSDVKISLVSGGSMTLKNATGKTISVVGGTLQSNSGCVTLRSSSSKTSLIGTSYADSLYIDNSSVTVSAGDGNDTIRNRHDYTIIDSGAGNDYIYNDTGSYTTTNGGNGNDTIISKNSYPEYANSHSINGGAGSDIISIHGGTVRGGTDNDTIYAYSSSARGNIIYQFSAGDGNDIIYGYTSNDTISLGGGYYTRETINTNDVRISLVSGGSMTLKNAKGEKINIKGGTLQSGTIPSGGVTLSSSSSKTSLIGTSYADSLYNGYSSVTVNADDGKDTIYSNNGDYSSINGGAGNDSIYAYDNDYVNVNAGPGNDTVTGNYYNSKIYGGDGNDKLTGHYSFSSSVVDGGNGSDTIIAQAGSVNGGADNDSINVYNTYGYLITVKGGTGDDTIIGSTNSTVGTLYQYASGDGYDLIQNWKANDTLSLGSGIYYTRSTVSSNVVVSIQGGGAVTLSGASSKTINIKGGTLQSNSGGVTLSSSSSKTSLIGTSYADSLYNGYSSVTVNADDGKDTIYSNNGDYSSINGGAGNDSIYAYNNDYVTVNAGAGNDTVKGEYYASKIFSGDGNDFISINGGYYYSTNTINAGSGDDTVSALGASINGGEGNDSIDATNSSGKYTVLGGAGNDTINGNTGSIGILYKYNSGDGYDLIQNWASNNTLSLGSGIYYTRSTVSSNVVVSIQGGGAVTLSGASSKTINIKGGKEKEVNKNSWTISGTTAKYGTSSKTLITIKGLKSGLKASNGTISGISLSGKVVTLLKSVLDTSKVTLKGEDYTLKLGSDVDQPSTKKAAWTFDKSTSTATYNGSYKTKGYTLASNGKSITYTAATSAKSLATVAGASSTSGIKVSGQKITLKNSSLKNKVTVSGNYEFDFASDYNNATITGSNNGDTIVTRGKNLSVDGGKGADTIKVLGNSNTIKGGAGADIFVYKSGKNVIADYATEDTISIASGTAKVTTSSSDVVFSIGSGKLTVKGGADKTVTYSANGKKQTYSAAKITLPASSDETVILPTSYKESSYTLHNGFYNADASAVRRDIKITGNDSFNSILGGAGNDTLIGGKSNDSLTGGKGSDIFLYNKGDGNDLITDYEEDDTILIKGDTVSQKTASDKDIIFTLKSKSKITIAGGAYKIIDYTDAKGAHTYSHFVKYDSKGKSATLESDYSKESFEPKDYGKYVANLVKIDASEVDKDLLIIGNDKNNSIQGTVDDDTILGGKGNDSLWSKYGNDSIIGGKGADYLYGGEGNDTLWGGEGNDYLWGSDGKDTFIYEPGDGKDRIFDYNPNEDKIMLLSGKVDNCAAVGSDVVFTIGDGEIILDKAASQYAEIVSGSGKVLKPRYIPKKRS